MCVEQERGSDRPEREEPQDTAPSSQDRRGLLRGSGNTLCPEGCQGACGIDVNRDMYCYGRNRFRESSKENEEFSLEQETL